MDFVDFITEGVRIFFFRIKDFSLLALAAMIPTGLLILLAAGVLPARGTAAIGVKIILLVLGLALQVVVSLITSMSSKIITQSVVDNKSISLGGAIQSASSMVGTAFMTQLLASLIVLGLSFLLFIPGVIYSIYYIFVLDAVALRDKVGKDALKYSKTLVEGQWWLIFGISMGFAIIFFILNVLITFLLGRVSGNPYFAMVPYAVTVYLAGLLGVVSTVFFLNTDFINHRRMARRKELANETRTKKAPTIEEYWQSKHKAKTLSFGPSTAEDTTRKMDKTKSVKKQSRRTGK